MDGSSRALFALKEEEQPIRAAAKKALKEKIALSEAEKKKAAEAGDQTKKELNAARREEEKAKVAAEPDDIALLREAIDRFDD